MEGARRVLGGERTADQELAAKERMAAEVKKTGEAMLKTLGEMKGLPLVGQMAKAHRRPRPAGHGPRSRPS